MYARFELWRLEVFTALRDIFETEELLFLSHTVVEQQFSIYHYYPEEIEFSNHIMFVYLFIYSISLRNLVHNGLSSSKGNFL